jgi:predicted Zn-dependent protease
MTDPQIIKPATGTPPVVLSPTAATSTLSGAVAADVAKAKTFASKVKAALAKPWVSFLAGLLIGLLAPRIP